jgi:arylamine N-acetyltransferase
LRHLGLSRGSPPNLPFLKALVDNYVRTVPFETASRIVKRARTAQTKDCPRWPEEFWQASMQHGCGGTCFESQYALFALLQTLGYEGYLTINHMRDCAYCHAAIVLSIAETRWLVDVTLPLYAPVQLEPDTMTAQATPFLNYTVQPDAASAHYRVERAPHPFPYAGASHIGDKLLKGSGRPM